MKGQFLISELLATPWALRREVLAGHAHVIARWLAGHGGTLSMDDDGWREKKSDFEMRRQAANSGVRANGGAIAVIPVYGTIQQRAGVMTEYCGGTSCNDVSAALSEAMADDTVSQILMEFDSPGGSVYGVDELAAQIYEARKTKPIIGIANSLSASASYYLQSQCSEAYVTPGGEVGSIGVWMAHEDWSKALEATGVKTTIISAGKYKVEGNPYTPLDAEARDFMQSRVNDYYSAFVRAVARGRGCGVDQVRDGMGQGRVLGAADAKAAGMVDGVMTMQEVIRKMQRDARTPGRQQASRARQEAAAREIAIAS